MLFFGAVLLAGLGVSAIAFGAPTCTSVSHAKLGLAVLGRRPHHFDQLRATNEGDLLPFRGFAWTVCCPHRAELGGPHHDGE